MSRRLFNAGFSSSTYVITRTLASKVAVQDLKILGVGAGNKPVADAQKQLASLGYKQTKIFGIYNTKKSDQEFINALKEKQWDIVALGGYVNGFDQASKYHEEGVSTDRAEILHWFNRILNLVHKLAPNAKIVLLKGPQDLPDALERVVNQEKN
ncbi:unnamed protein product [Adineta ricciae]|uniref:Uncharacterized protein n=1 Tax=Adineta ricciae TaxID=249248 RepID=A0A814KQ68_ADIRI|nr:unnamed protein product [Adineta ricciae]CAF1319264.1 unnamed protein product [Adineta ricciae]